MRNVAMTIWMVVAVFILVSGQGFGWVQFKDGGVHNITTIINDDVWVDYLAPGMQTTVNILDGGSISSSYDLQGYNESRMNITGGSVGWLTAYDNSQATIDGTVNHDLRTLGNSRVTLSGGMVEGWLWAGDNSQVTISGGSVMNAPLWAYSNSQITMSGGSVPQFVMEDNVKAIIIGSNFLLDGEPVGYGYEIKSVLGGSVNDEPYRRITGILANGDVLNTQFLIGSYGSITLIPEPATLSLLALGAFLAGRKRK